MIKIKIENGHMVNRFMEFITRNSGSPDEKLRDIDH